MKVIRSGSLDACCAWHVRFYPHTALCCLSCACFFFSEPLVIARQSQRRERPVCSSCDRNSVRYKTDLGHPLTSDSSWSVLCTPTRSRSTPRSKYSAMLLVDPECPASMIFIFICLPVLPDIHPVHNSYSGGCLPVLALLFEVSGNVLKRNYSRTLRGIAPI